MCKSALILIKLINLIWLNLTEKVAFSVTLV